MKKKKPDFSDLALHKTDYSIYASNVFAVAPDRSDDGHTRIAINSHQPWTGPVTWYEAHIHSNEGWNILGGLFPGSPVVLVGHNENLGWGHTVNKPDIVDIYELEINPNNANAYSINCALDRSKCSFFEKIEMKASNLNPMNYFNKRKECLRRNGILC